MDKNEIKVKGAETVTAEQTNKYNHEAGDKAVYIEGKNRTEGMIISLDIENGVPTALFKPFSSEIKPFKVKTTNNNFHSLTFKPNEGKYKFMSFSFKEVGDFFKDPSKSFGLDYNAAKNAKIFLPLALGNRTKVIDQLQIKTKATEEKPSKVIDFSGRLEIKWNKSYGYQLKADEKHRLKVGDDGVGRLNLDKSIYSYKLDDSEKKQIQEAFENKNETAYDIGLKKIELVDPGTGEVEEFNVYIALDPDLQKLITRSEKSINIDKVFGVVTTDKQKEELKKGKYVEVDFKAKNSTKTEKRIIKIAASSTRKDGIYFLEKDHKIAAKILEKKNPNTKKGVKIK